MNYPKTEEDMTIFLDKLAHFKSELFLKCLEKLIFDEKDKYLVLEKTFEILEKRKNEDVI